MDDVKFHFRNALIDHSYPFSGRRRDIDRASTNERTTIVDSNDDRTSVNNVPVQPVDATLGSDGNK